MSAPCAARLRQRAPGRGRAGGDAAHQEVRDHLADRGGRVGASGRNQVTVQFIAPSMARATIAGFGVDQLTGSNAVGDQPAQRLFVAIALLDDGARAAPAAATRSAGARSRPRCRRAACCRCAVQTQAQAFGGRRRRAARRGHGLEHAIERAILAIEQQIVLAVEVVIQVRGRQIRGVRDVAHAGVGEAALAKQPRRGAQNGVALAVAAARARRGQVDL